jgi:CO dehydrogenase/acetyl-CoA synthase alpha subunit
MPYKDPQKRKEKQKEYAKKYYEDNIGVEKIRLQKTKKEKRAEWYAFKNTLKCTECEFNHPAALDFHHTNPKEKEGNVHKFISNGNFAKAYKEVKKCIVLCANCHRIHHYEERLIKKARRNGQWNHSSESSSSSSESSNSSNNQESSSSS